MYEYLDKRYALALYEVAEEKGKVLEFINDLKTINSMIEENGELKKILQHPYLSSKKKKELFIKIFKNTVDDEILTFLILLIKKDRVLFLKEKIDEMEKIHLEKNNTLIGIVKTSYKLDEKYLKKIIAIFEKKYNKKIILEEIIEPDIIGGIIVILNNEIYDYTIKSELIKIKSKIMEESRW